MLAAAKGHDDATKMLLIAAVGDGNGNKENVRQVTNALVKHGASPEVELSIPVLEAETHPDSS